MSHFVAAPTLLQFVNDNETAAAVAVSIVESYPAFAAATGLYCDSPPTAADEDRVVDRVVELLARTTVTPEVERLRLDDAEFDDLIAHLARETTHQLRLG